MFLRVSATVWELVFVVHDIGFLPEAIQNISIFAGDIVVDIVWSEWEE